MSRTSIAPKTLITMSLAFTLFAVASKASARSVTVFSGGFGSCAMMGSTSELKSSARMDALVDSIARETGEKPIEVRTCYAIGSNPIYVSAPELDLIDVAMSRDEFHDVVRQAAQAAGESAPVYVWGQSHGGWTAMNLVASVDDVNFRTLTTVDPISVVDCGPMVFSGGVLTGYSEGCRQAPNDLKPVYPVIAKRTKSWINWYQIEFSILHSSAITHASQNIKRKYNADWWVPMGSHAMTEGDPVMWTQTTQSVVNDISRRQPEQSWRQPEQSWRQPEQSEGSR